MLKRLARWVLRHELAGLQALHDQWRSWALVQERWRREAHGETPESPEFREWFFKTYSNRETLPERSPP
jgi:hypothetical protein